MSISEQVKELRKVAENFREWEYNRFYDVISEVADTIESLSAKLQAANMERSAENYGGWIPCRERLPRENKEVICFFRDGTVSACMLIYNRFHGKMYSYRVSDVICWKPLPEPPYEP